MDVMSTRQQTGSSNELLIGLDYAASEAWESDTLGSCDRSIWPGDSPLPHLFSLKYAFGCEVGKPAKTHTSRTVASTIIALKHLSGTRCTTVYSRFVNRSHTLCGSEEAQQASTFMVSRLAKKVSVLRTDNVKRKALKCSCPNAHGRTTLKRRLT